MNKRKGILFLALLTIVLISWHYRDTSQAEPRKINLQGYVSSDPQGQPIAIVNWDAKNVEECGFRVIKNYNNQEKTAAIFNPEDVGDDPVSSGFYIDSAVALNQTYTYKIYAFDRMGEDYYLGQLDLKIVPGEGTK